MSSLARSKKTGRQTSTVRFFVLLLLFLSLNPGANRALPGTQRQPANVSAAGSLPATATPTPTIAPQINLARLKVQFQLTHFKDALTRLDHWDDTDSAIFRPQMDHIQLQLDRAKSMVEYQALATQISQMLQAIQLPLARAQARFLARDYHATITAWRASHIFHDPFDGQDYPLGPEYDTLSAGYGAGWLVDNALANAETHDTLDTYQISISTTSNLLSNFQAMRANFGVSTAWNAAHITDQLLLRHYHVAGNQAIVLSLNEQAIRIYQHGQLLRAMQIASGRPERPTPAGFFSIQRKLAPARFVSSDPPDSAYYYAPLNLAYALGFTPWGHYFHDAVWRTIFGAGPDYRANYPHADVNPAAQSGSHGCVNMALADAAWLYHTIDDATAVIIY